MDSFQNILKDHAEKYPLMTSADVVKLVYQATFGGGHMINDYNTAAERIREEYTSVSHTSEHLRVESLGDSARVYLDTELTERELDIIARLFCASAKHYPCCCDSADESARNLFDARIADVEQLCHDGSFAFNAAELDAYLTDYRAKGCPAVSHSEVYREAYRPAYRVIDGRYARLLNCIFAIGELLEKEDRVVLAIDGRAASGKTTVAGLISEVFPASVIHMDDFFLPRELRTKERLGEVGGNIHYERFSVEVIPHLRTGKPFYHMVFDCSMFDFSDKPKKIEPARLIICEGSYSLHPFFGKYYDIKYFSDVDPETQRERIRIRNGERMLERFVREWIPMEERYFASLDKSL